METAQSIFNCTLSYLIAYVGYMIIFVAISYVQTGEINLEYDIFNQKTLLGRLNTVIFIVSVILLLVMLLSGLYLSLI